MIAEWRRVRVSLDAFFVDDPIQLEGRDARADVGGGDVENLAAELRGRDRNVSAWLRAYDDRRGNTDFADFAHLDNFFGRAGATLTLVDEGDLLAKRHAVCCSVSSRTWSTPARVER